MIARMARPVNRISVPVAGARAEASRLIVALAAAAGLLLALPVALVGSATPVAGHSQLVISVPAAGQVLPTSPTAISLVFSEQNEPRYGSLDLLDAAGGTILAGAGAPDPTDPDVLTVTLAAPSPPPSPSGTTP
jgi:methionine-rich copper-binding protein CopC